jgi:hypothetical protein
MYRSISRGDPYLVPEYDESDARDAALSLQQSNESEQRESEMSRDFFSDDYSIDQYDAPAVAPPRHISEGRTRVRFSEPMGIKCEEGKQPIFPPRQIPYGYYLPTPSKACTNSPNVFLTWDNEKYKYCCNSEPDSLEKMLKHSKDVLYNMIHSVEINYKSMPDLQYAAQKYMSLFRKLNTPENTQLEIQKINKLIQTFFLKLTPGNQLTDLGIKSLREEREEPLRSMEANAMPEWMGGMRRRSRRKQQQQKRRRSGGKRSKRSRK